MKRREISGLPILSPTERVPLVSTSTGYRQAVKMGHSSFIRPVRFIPSVIGTAEITDFLTSADTIFKQVAKNCGAFVVKHEWGLIESNARLARRAMLWNDAAGAARYQDPVPAGFVLGARVATVADTYGRRLTPTEVTRIDGAIANHTDGARIGELIWTDGEEYQFRPSGAHGSKERRITLVDIEPIMNRKTEPEPRYPIY